MATIIEAIDQAAKNSWMRIWQAPGWKQFVLTGDRKHLKALPAIDDYAALPVEILTALGDPGGLNEQGRRFLLACVEAKFSTALGQWLRHGLAFGQPARDSFEAARAVLADFGCAPAQLGALTIRHIRELVLANGEPNGAGKFLLTLSTAEMASVLEALSPKDDTDQEFAAFFGAHAPAKILEILEKRLKKSPTGDLDVKFWIALLKADKTRFAGMAARVFERLKELSPRFWLGKDLADINPAQFRPVLTQIALDLLMGNGPAGSISGREAVHGACWLIANSAEAAMPALKKYIGTDPAGTASKLANDHPRYRVSVLEAADTHLGRGAIPLYEAAFEIAQPEPQLQALQLWVPKATPEDVPMLASHFRTALAGGDFATVARCVRLAGEWNVAAIEADLWPLLGHKSRPVRDAAASVLAKLGDSRLTKAAELWTARRADSRLAAVNWLKTLGTPAAANELKSRLEIEEDEDVRDGILLALEKLGGGNQIEPAELKRRIKKTVAKLSGPPVKWLEVGKLPVPGTKAGKPLDADSLLYLLYRQSRVKEIRADIEAKPLYAQLDRSTSGDLGIAVLQGFFGSKMEAEDRWVLAFAALTGDDRLVPLLGRQIKEWADGSRGKLAEYAVQALALLGTDSALLAVDAMGIRYRSKNKNIGKAAVEAFAEAARARGLTVEELGDLVVPWFGFKPDETRIVETVKGKIETRISSDFKLTFHDAGTRKKIAKLPDSAPAEIKAEFKELAAGLKEAVKAQLLRMETLMVRQFRWPQARWQELYLRHPLLLPFAQRLIWGVYDEQGKLAATFRALEDRSLTDAQDEAFELPSRGSVGIVHPLELSVELRQAWVKHLADYDIVPPFAQLDRPVVKVKPEQRSMKFGVEVAGTEMNGMTFKGRAERLGWSRGSVIDGGSINFYYKSFPAAGVDIFVELDGMYVAMDMYAEIKLGRTFFVKHGSVQVSGYNYDEPGKESDERLVAYGEVPDIAFSEAMGDLARIAGKGSSEKTEAGQEDA